MTKKLLLNETARKWLKVEGACSECFPWACKNGETLAELVRKARPDWALWALLRSGVLTDRELWLFACWCAEQTLPNWYAVYPDDHRPRQAIEALRGWLDGKVSDDDLRSARSAARSAARLVLSSAARSAESAESALSARLVLSSAARSAESVLSVQLVQLVATWSVESALSAARLVATWSAELARAARAAQVQWILANCEPKFVDSQEVVG